MELDDLFRLLSVAFVLAEAKNGCKEFNYLPCIKNKTLTGHVIKSLGVLVPGLELCQNKCFSERQCVSYNLGPVDGQTRTCELSAADDWMRPNFLVSKEGFEYCPIKNPCSSNPCPSNRLCTPDFSWDTFSCDDGGWTQWGLWSPCCINGKQNRTRSCSNPPRQNNGASCVGEHVETAKECTTKNDFKNIGCFVDKNNQRALPDRLDAGDKPYTICNCGRKAQSKGYKVFAVQSYGSDCWSGPTADKTYNRHGSASNCPPTGIGGLRTNDVYRIIEIP